MSVLGSFQNPKPWTAQNKAPRKWVLNSNPVSKTFTQSTEVDGLLRSLPTYVTLWLYHTTLHRFYLHWYLCFDCIEQKVKTTNDLDLCSCSTYISRVTYLYCSWIWPMKEISQRALHTHINLFSGLVSLNQQSDIRHLKALPGTTHQMKLLVKPKEKQFLRLKN